MAEIATWSAILDKTGLGKTSNECPTKVELLALNNGKNPNTDKLIVISQAGNYGNNECVKLEDINAEQWTYFFEFALHGDPSFDAPATGGNYKAESVFSVRAKAINGKTDNFTTQVVDYTTNGEASWYVMIDTESRQVLNNTTDKRRSHTKTFTQKYTNSILQATFTQEAGEKIYTDWKYDCRVDKTSLDANGGQVNVVIKQTVREYTWNGKGDPIVLSEQATVKVSSPATISGNTITIPANNTSIKRAFTVTFEFATAPAYTVQISQREAVIVRSILVGPGGTVEKYAFNFINPFIDLININLKSINKEVLGGIEVDWEHIYYKGNSDLLIAVGNSVNYDTNHTPTTVSGYSTWVAISSGNQATEWKVKEVLKNVNGSLGYCCTTRLLSSSGNTYKLYIFIVGAYHHQNSIRYPIAKIDLNLETVEFLEVSGDPGKAIGHRYNSICSSYNGRIIAAGYQGIAISDSSGKFTFKKIDFLSPDHDEWNCISSIDIDMGPIVMVSCGKDYAYSTNGIDWTVKTAPFEFLYEDLYGKVRYRSVLTNNGNIIYNLFVALLGDRRSLAYTCGGKDNWDWKVVSLEEFGLTNITAITSLPYSIREDPDNYLSPSISGVLLSGPEVEGYGVYDKDKDHWDFFKTSTKSKNFIPQSVVALIN